jgi:acetyl esterase/lipase
MRVLLCLLAGLLALAMAPPAQAAPPLEAYGKLPALEFVRLSPSGDKIAFVAVDGETRRLFIRKVGGDALLVSTVGTAKVRDIEWAGDDYVLVKASATVKFGNGALDKWSYTTRAELMVAFIANLKTLTVTKMFNHKELEVAYAAIGSDYGPRLIDGRWYEFVSAFTNNHGMNVYKVDLETGKYSILTAGVGEEFGFVVGADGAIAGRAQYDVITRTWSLYTGLRGKQVAVSRVSPLDTVDLEGPGRTPGTLLVSDTDGQNDFFDEYPIEAGAAPTRLFEGKRIETFLFDPSSRLLIGALEVGGQTGIFFDPKLQRRFEAVKKAFPGYQVSLESWSADLGRLVVKTDGADDSGTYWLVNMATGKADELMSAYPAIGPKDVGPTRIFSYEAADGLPLEGVLTLPPGRPDKALPLVVLPHGGPIGVHDKIGFDWWAQAFASRGYAVFQPNYRGSSGYGAPFREKGMGEWGRRMLTDMSDGVEALARAGVVDKDRVCIVGGSYGGYAALASVILHQGLYRCAVSVAGVSDVSAVMASDGDNGEYPSGRYNQKMYGVKSASDPVLLSISPLRHPEAASAPILLIHGKDDTVVPFVHSLTMNDALTKAGKTSQLVALDSEDHFLSREATRVQTLEASVNWVEKYNPAS